MTLDFGGTWERDLQAQLKSDLGRMTLRLPRDTGGRVTVDSEISNIDAGEFAETNGVYVNEAYGTAAVTFDIAIEQEVGDITLELIDGDQAVRWRPFDLAISPHLPRPQRSSGSCWTSGRRGHRLPDLETIARVEDG